MASDNETIARINKPGFQTATTLDAGVKLAHDRARDVRKRTMTELRVENISPEK